MKGYLFAAALAALVAATPAAAGCVGDCNGDLRVTIDELVLGVRVELGEVAVSLCPASDCEVPVGPPIPCLIFAVNNAMAGCPDGP